MIGKMNWPSAAVVIAIIGLFGVLAAMRIPFDVAGLLLVLGGIGFVATRQAENIAKTDAVRDQTNGSNTKMLQMIESVYNILAVSPAISADTLSEIAKHTASPAPPDDPKVEDEPPRL